MILPFAGTEASVFAKTILLAWDDVPAAPSCLANDATPAATSADTGRLACAATRTFEVRLHVLRIGQNGQTGSISGNWRVWVDVAGQWRDLSRTPFDRNGDGDNVCKGDALTDNGDGDCFRFDGQPWTVNVQDGQPIHVAVVGYKVDRNGITGGSGVDSDFCPFLLGAPSRGCDPSASAAIDLAFHNDERVGTIEFDLQPNVVTCRFHGLEPPCYYYTGEFGGRPGSTCSTGQLSGEEQVLCTTLGPNLDPKDDREIDYRADFRIRAGIAANLPTSSLSVGSPEGLGADGTSYVTSQTPFTFSTRGFLGSAESLAVQYRFRREGSPLPTFPSSLPFPLHWQLASPTPTGSYSPVFLSGQDGPYILQYSAQVQTSVGGLRFPDLTEPWHTVRFVLDATPPIVTPPSDITIAATEPAGATWQASPPLGAFLFGSSATDMIDPSPTGLWPQVNGSDVLPSTLFPTGTTQVFFGAIDAAGNLARASATVTVVLGQPSLTGQVLGSGSGGPGVVFVDFRLKNTGTGVAQAVIIQTVSAALVAGRGAVSFDAAQSPILPISVGALSPGGLSHLLRMSFDVGRRVTAFSFTVNGTAQTVSGTTFAFSASQTIQV